MKEISKLEHKLDDIEGRSTPSSHHCELCQIQDLKNSSKTEKAKRQYAMNLHLGRLYPRGKRLGLQTLVTPSTDDDKEDLTNLSLGEKC